MKTFQVLLFLVAASLFSTLYAETPESPDSSEGTSSSEATVVFMRSSFVGAAIKTSIYEVTDDETKFIGILKNKNKINYETTAGKHTFMVVSEAADFMEADVLAGKTYYSIITPRAGAWKARFSMHPIRNNGTTKFNTGTKDFEKWKKKTKLTTMTDKSEAWYEKHKESVESKREKYWPKWTQKTAEELAQRTLNPDDGI